MMYKINLNYVKWFENTDILVDNLIFYTQQDAFYKV
jgi:hypothetical protein